MVKLASADGAIEVNWQAVLRDGSSYVRQVITCQSIGNEVELAEVVVWDLAVPGAEVRGVVDGSPVVAGNLYFAAEHPMSKSTLVAAPDAAAPPRFTCSYQVNGGLRYGEPRQFRALVGVSPPGQMRRGFLYYLERERAQPYRPLLHYNNGSEIGCEYWALQSSRQHRGGRNVSSPPTAVVARHDRAIRPGTCPATSGRRGQLCPRLRMG